MRYQINQLTFDNGVSGLIVDIPNATSVYCLLNFSGGYDAVEDYQHKYEVPNVLAEGAFDVQGYNGDDFYNTLTLCGALCDVDAYTGSVEYSAKCPRYDVARVLDLMAQMLERPDVTAECLAREKKNIANRLEKDAMDGGGLLVQRIMARLGRKQLLPRDAIATLDNITLEDVQRYRERVFTTDNLRFIVAGDFSGDHTVADRLRVLGLPRGVRPERPILQAPDGTQGCLEYDASAKIVLVHVAFALRRSLTVRDELIVELIGELLTGGFDSLVFGEARRQGWAYYAHMNNFITNLSVNLPIIMEFRSSWENVSRMVRLTADMLIKLSRGELANDRLERARRILAGRKSMSYNIPRSIANAISYRYFASGEVVDLNAAPEIIRNITVADIQQLVQEILVDNSRLLGVFGDVTEAQAKDAVAALDAALSQGGKMKCAIR